jgi:hypothetical protein
MQIELITREDLQLLRQQLLSDIRALLGEKQDASAKEWLRSGEVRKLLKISPGTLQNLRINGLLSPSKVNGIYFYRYADVIRMLETVPSKPGKHIKKWT